MFGDTYVWIIIILWWQDIIFIWRGVLFQICEMDFLLDFYFGIYFAMVSASGFPAG